MTKPPKKIGHESAVPKKGSQHITFFNRVRKLLGKDAFSYGRKAWIFYETDRFQKAEIFFNKAIKVNDKSHPSDSSLKISLSISLGMLLVDTARYTEADELLNNILASCDADDRVHVYFHLSRIRANLGRFDSSEKMLLKGLNILKENKLSLEEDPFAAKLYYALYEIYNATNRKDEAKEMLYKAQQNDDGFNKKLKEIFPTTKEDILEALSGTKQNE